MKLLVLAALLTSQVFADASIYDDQYHEIKAVEVYELTKDVNGMEKAKLLQSQKIPTYLEQELSKARRVRNKSVGEVIMVTKELIALGKEIYKIIEAGKPVVSLNSAPVSVLPRDERGQYVDAFYLTNWRAPQARKYRVEVKNYLGMTPVSFEFMMIFSYNGSHNGKGKYITGAQIKPTVADVSWGYNLDATFSVQSIMNQGSTANPVAGATIMIDYTIKTLLKESRNNKTFYINGLGQSQAY